MNAATQALGKLLRTMRQERGWSLSEVDRQSGGRWNQPLVGSYERAARNASWPQVMDLMAFYGNRTIAILEPGDVVVRAGEQGAGERVVFVVDAPGLVRPIECESADEAHARAGVVAGGWVGYRTIGAVRPVAPGSDLPQTPVEQAEAASPPNDRGGAA